MPPEVMTVTGPVEPGDLGFTLPHEHVISRFGAEPARYPDYPIAAVLDQVLPYLASVKARGVNTLVDCTTAFFGRHPELLQRISIESGVHILTNTGYYAARDARYVPPHAFKETPEAIAARWTREWRDGIDETGVRPGFIKIAVEKDPLSEIEIKLVHAAIHTHLDTSLVIQTHTGDNLPAARRIMDWVEAAGAPLSAWIWVHANAVSESATLLEAAERGAWISLDGVAAEPRDHILAHLKALCTAGFQERVLLSHDGDSFTFEGGLRPYEYLMSDFIPLLKDNGFSDTDIHQLTVANPARAFSIDMPA